MSDTLPTPCRRYAKLAEAAHSHETRRTVLRSSEGPPPPGELQAYNDALPGCAERILRMAERALDAQIEVDTTLARGDVQSVRRGQWQSTGIASLSLVCALIVAAAGAPWAVVAVFVAPPIFEFGTSLVRTIREPQRTSDEEDGPTVDWIGLPYDPANRRLFGVPVVASNAQTAGVGHAVASDSVALDSDTRGVDVQWSENATADTFGKNLVFARCESRYATSVFGPLGVVSLDLTP